MERIAILFSISHWKRIIREVKKINFSEELWKEERVPYRTRTIFVEMERMLGENIKGKYCYLCLYYKEDCNNCPIKKKLNCCCGDEGSVWMMCYKSRSKEEFLKNAENMLLLLRSLL